MDMDIRKRRECRAMSSRAKTEIPNGPTAVLHHHSLLGRGRRLSWNQLRHQLADYSHDDPKRQAVSKVPKGLLAGIQLKRARAAVELMCISCAISRPWSHIKQANQHAYCRHCHRKCQKEQKHVASVLRSCAQKRDHRKMPQTPQQSQVNRSKKLFGGYSRWTPLRAAGNSWLNSRDNSRVGSGISHVPLMDVALRFCS